MANLLEFLAWAARTGSPVRGPDGVLRVWDTASETFKEIDNYGIEALYVAEIGGENISVRESLVKLSQELTANSISKLKFDMVDPEFKMHKANYFVLDRIVNFNGWFYKIVESTAHYRAEPRMLSVTAMPANAVKLITDKGATDFGAISPTTFAAQKAAEFGMQFFGETSAIDGHILRRYNDTTKESTWDVLRTLAKKLDFSVFEGNNMLFFASDKYIIDNQPVQTVNIPSLPEDAMYAYTASVKRTTHERSKSAMDMSLHKNAQTASLFPGVCLKTIGMGLSDSMTFMITNVRLDIRPSSKVMVTSRSVDVSEDATCTSQTFSTGSTGFCVKRIQQAVGTSTDGKFGPITEGKVKELQTAANISVTGIVDSATWDAIEART